MLRAISIVGRKNAGKTTLIERLLPELRARGHRVATIKHDAHDFEIDVPGKDSWRHRQAGSDTTIIVSPSKIAMVRLTEREADLDELLRLVDASYDLVLIEGFRRSALPKIVVHRQELEGRPLAVHGEIWAVVSEGDPGLGVEAPRFGPDQTKALVDLIEQRLLDNDKSRVRAGS